MIAKIYLKNVFNGTMSQIPTEKFLLSNPIEIHLSISPDARAIDIEKLFQEIQNKILLWTRDMDTDCKYITDKKQGGDSYE